jgi:hypothetical protein
MRLTAFRQRTGRVFYRHLTDRSALRGARSGASARRERHVRVEADDNVNDEIDAAYRTKYHRCSARYVDPIVSPQARAATIKLVPRSTNRAQ